MCSCRSNCGSLNYETGNFDRARLHPKFLHTNATSHKLHAPSMKGDGYGSDTSYNFAPLKAKLYMGTVKLLKHIKTAMVWLVMRQAKTLKIYAKHLGAISDRKG